MNPVMPLTVLAQASTEEADAVGRLFDPIALLILLGAGVVGFAAAAIIRAARGDSGGKAALRGLEAGLMTFAGGLLARSFIAGLLLLADDSSAAVVLVSLAFFLWPGVINLVAWLVTGAPVIGVDALLVIAAAVGGFAGFMDGLWAVHRWRGVGWLTFPLDVTWGLAGTTNACLMHLCNFAWADHAEGPGEERRGAHRYKSGFRIKADFAFTQGNVMSNMGSHAPTNPPAKSLWRHERVHVNQNRGLGPLFTLVYVGWMGLMLIPAIIAGLAAKAAGVGKTIEWWCYYDNAYEQWAYQYGGYMPAGIPLLRWPAAVVLIVSIPVCLGMLALAALAVIAVWF